MSRIAIFFATGFEEIEALTVVDICRRAGLSIDMVSVTGERLVESSHKVTVQTDKLLSEADFAEYDMLLLPGGMPGTTNLDACAELMEHVEAFYKAGKYIGAICAAPGVIFGARGFLKGRKACSNPGFEDRLEGAEVTKGPVEVDGHVITSRGMGTAIDFGLAVAEVFCGKEKTEELAKKLVYRQD